MYVLIGTHVAHLKYVQKRKQEKVIIWLRTKNYKFALIEYRINTMKATQKNTK
jgi:hypothetical protein